MQKAIDEARYMLSLKEGWDDERAVPIQQSTFDRMAEFIHMYAALVPKLPEPSICPCSTGDIDISWDINEVDIVVRILTTGNKAVYYCINTITRKDYNKAIHDCSKADLELIYWMQLLGNR